MAAVDAAAQDDVDRVVEVADYAADARGAQRLVAEFAFVDAVDHIGMGRHIGDDAGDLGGTPGRLVGEDISDVAGVPAILDGGPVTGNGDDTGQFRGGSAVDFHPDVNVALAVLEEGARSTFRGDTAVLDGTGLDRARHLEVLHAAVDVAEQAAVGIRAGFGDFFLVGDLEALAVHVAVEGFGRGDRAGVDVRGEDHLAAAAELVGIGEEALQVFGGGNRNRHGLRIFRCQGIHQEQGLPRDLHGSGGLLLRARE